MMNTPAHFTQQDQEWVTADRRVLRIDDMDPDHRSNLIPFLRGNVVTLYINLHGDRPTRQEAEEWLEQTPLMRRLVELERGRSIEDRRATNERNVAYEQATGYRKVRLG